MSYFLAHNRQRAWKSTHFQQPCYSHIIHNSSEITKLVMFNALSLW